MLGGGVVEGHELPVAAGRRPLTDDLRLETIGPEPDGFILVDNHLRVPGMLWLYAIGDVNGRSLPTHVGKHHAHAATDFILERRSGA